MIIYSEKTKEKYDSIEACEQAEKEFDTALAKKEEEKKALSETRKVRAKEVEDAYRESIEARQKFVDLMQKFIDDYGSFHMTYSNQDENGKERIPTEIMNDPLGLFNAMLNSFLMM